MAKRSNAGRSLTPFLRLPGTYALDDDDIPTADHDGWVEYWIWLGGGHGFPRQVAMFFEGRFKALNVPEVTPEEFDFNFTRDPKFKARLADIGERIAEERKNRRPPLAQLHNVFVPTFAPQYADMVARGGRPGVSLEDEYRQGVWVPLEWLGGSERLGRRHAR